MQRQHQLRKMPFNRGSDNQLQMTALWHQQQRQIPINHELDSLIEWIISGSRTDGPSSIVV